MEGVQPFFTLISPFRRDEAYLVQEKKNSTFKIMESIILSIFSSMIYDLMKQYINKLMKQ